MLGRMESAYSANCWSDFITTLLLKTCLKTACLTVPPMSSIAPFPWFASKKMPLQGYVSIKLGHHVKCILTMKLASTSIRPKLDWRNQGFFFKLIDEEFVKSKAYIAATVIFQCYKCITFACNIFIFFHVNPHSVQRKLTLNIVCWYDLVLLFVFIVFGKVNMNNSFSFFDFFNLFFIFLALCSFFYSNASWYLGCNFQVYQQFHHFLFL